jgi:hypothetical protein
MRWRRLPALPPGSVGEIHLAGHLDRRGGHRPSRRGGGAAGVGTVPRRAARFGPVPTLVEWDTDIPALDVLLAEAGERADAALARPVPAPRPRLAREHACRPERGGAAPPFFDATSKRSARPCSTRAESAWRACWPGGDTPGASASIAATWPRLGASLAKPIRSAPAGRREDSSPRWRAPTARRMAVAGSDLNFFGARFAGFLAGFEPLADYPYLPDMARLEWAVHLRPTMRADAPALGPPDLAGSIRNSNPRFVAASGAARCTLRRGRRPSCGWRIRKGGGVSGGRWGRDSLCACRTAGLAGRAVAQSARQHLRRWNVANGACFGEAIDAAFGAGRGVQCGHAPETMAGGRLALPQWKQERAANRPRRGSVGRPRCAA